MRPKPSPVIRHATLAGDDEHGHVPRASLRATYATVTSLFYPPDKALFGHDHCVFGEFGKDALRHTEIGAEQKIGVGGQPAGNRDRFIASVVEPRHHLEFAAAGVLDIVAVALRDVTDVACGKLVGARAPVGAAHSQ